MFKERRGATGREGGKSPAHTGEEDTQYCRCPQLLTPSPSLHCTPTLYRAQDQPGLLSYAHRTRAPVLLSMNQGSCPTPDAPVLPSPNQGLCPTLAEPGRAPVLLSLNQEQCPTLGTVAESDNFLLSPNQIILHSRRTRDSVLLSLRQGAREKRGTGEGRS